MNKKIHCLLGLFVCGGILALGMKMSPGQLMAMEQEQSANNESINETTESADSKVVFSIESSDMAVEVSEEPNYSETISSTIDSTTDSEIEETNPSTSEVSASTTPSESSIKEQTTDSSTLTGQIIVNEQQAQQTQNPKAAEPSEDLAEYLPGVAETTEVEENYQFSVVKNQSTGEFIESISSFAQEIAWENELYASVMISQAILETGSGSSSLSSPPNYNLFGVKGSYEGKSVSFSTQEDNGSGSLYTITASFRKYPSYKESLEDYAKLLKNGIDGNKNFYDKTWKPNTESYKDVTTFLTGRYATDTKYGSKLNALIEAYDLTQYDAKPGTKKQASTVEDSSTTEQSTTVKKSKSTYKSKSNSENNDNEEEAAASADKSTYIIKSWIEKNISVFNQPVKEILGTQNISSPIMNEESSSTDKETNNE